MSGATAWWILRSAKSAEPIKTIDHDPVVFGIVAAILLVAFIGMMFYVTRRDSDE